VNRGKELVTPILNTSNETVYKCNDFEVKGSTAKANNNPRIAESLDEELGHATEELITGDSDDPPLSEEAVVEMLRMTSKCSQVRTDIICEREVAKCYPVAVPFTKTLVLTTLFCVRSGTG